MALGDTRQPVRSLWREPESVVKQVEWPALQFNDVFKIYRSGPVETVALRGLELRVERGEMVAVLGPSGCGKSTMLALAAALDQPSAGEVRAGERSLQRLDEVELAQYRAHEVALIFQSENLWSTLSARENVAVGLRLARHEDPVGAAEDALGVFGLAARAGHRVGALSGGEQQRVAIAGAYARRAPLVLADEPTGELDAANERLVLEALSRVLDDGASSVVVVTHSSRRRRRRRPGAGDARRSGGRMSSVATATLAACRGVTVAYGSGSARLTALDGVDFQVGETERVALFGPSGSGKTTLLHLLGGLVVPEQGEVTWRGAPLSTLDALARGRERARGIALVFQGANLLPTFTAYENVAFAAYATNGNEHDSESAPDPADLLALVGLEAKLDALPGELSGGESQRVAIARALAQRPALLLCDEPTGHLDSDNGVRVLDLIDALQAEFGFAQVTATHDADVAARAERAVELADGRVVAEHSFS